MIFKPINLHIIYTIPSLSDVSYAPVSTTLPLTFTPFRLPILPLPDLDSLLLSIEELL
jgi:hypothetical protein